MTSSLMPIEPKRYLVYSHALICRKKQNELRMQNLHCCVSYLVFIVTSILFYLLLLRIYTNVLCSVS